MRTQTWLATLSQETSPRMASCQKKNIFLSQKPIDFLSRCQQGKNLKCFLELVGLHSFDLEAYSKRNYQLL